MLCVFKPLLLNTNSEDQHVIQTQSGGVLPIHRSVELLLLKLSTTSSCTSHTPHLSFPGTPGGLYLLPCPTEAVEPGQARSNTFWMMWFGN